VLNNIKAIILDRDGTLIEHVHYLSNPDEVRLLPGVKAGMKFLKKSNVRLFLHSNQSGVGRGYFGLTDVYNCNLRMEELLDLGSNVFDRMCIATEKPNDPIIYRKPSPKFALEIMRDFKFKASEICHVGDRSSDLIVAEEIGTKAIGVNTGLVDLKAELNKLGLSGHFPIMDSFDKAVEYGITL